MSRSNFLCSCNIEYREDGLPGCDCPLLYIVENNQFICTECFGIIDNVDNWNYDMWYFNEFNVGVGTFTYDKG